MGPTGSDVSFWSTAEHDMPAGEIAARIQRKLSDAFSPSDLKVVDESHLHAGHAGARPGGETHFRIRIVADAFKGKSRIERHRMVHSILAEELSDRVHALALVARAQGEEPRDP
jgi:BolA protein